MQKDEQSELDLVRQDRAMWAMDQAIRLCAFESGEVLLLTPNNLRQKLREIANTVHEITFHTPLE